MMNHYQLWERLGIDFDQLEAFCQQYDIAELALFGSVLRDDFNEESDIDLLVSYKATARRGLLEKVRMLEELRKLFRRKVDLVSKKAIANSQNWIRRRNILESAQVIYSN